MTLLFKTCKSLIKTIIKFSIFLFSLSFYFTLSTAKAGVRIVGNGGDVVVCENENKEIQFIDLLDHYEAVNYRNQVIDLGPEFLSVEDKIEIALQRLNKFSPDRANLYRQWLMSFFIETQFRRDIELVDIPDSNHSLLPKGCSIKQIANQATLLLPGQFRYTVDENLWDLLNNTQKAGLILHELVYRETLSLNHSQSINARLLAALMASPLMTEMSLKSFVNLLAQLEFVHLSVQGVQIDLRNQDFEFYNEHILGKAQVYEGSTFWDPRTQHFFPLRHTVEFNSRGEVKTLYLREPVLWKQHNLRFEIAPQIVKLYENGQIELAVVEQPVNILIDDLNIELTGHIEFYKEGILKRAKISLGNWKGYRIRSNVSFYKNGQPEFLDFVNTFEAMIQSQNIKVTSGTQFYEDMNIAQTWLAENVFLKNIHNQTKKYLKGQKITFNDQGLVLE